MVSFCIVEALEKIPNFIETKAKRLDSLFFLVLFSSIKISICGSDNLNSLEIIFNSLCLGSIS